MFDLIAFDADDTLWHSEDRYADAQRRFGEMLARCGASDGAGHLHEVEMRNLDLYGYGVKGFVLSMIEAALEAGGERITPADIGELLAIGRAMLRDEVRLLDHAHEALTALAAAHPLMVITKGDLIHQESKLKDSGLRPYFRHVEIVADKTPEVYGAILERHGVMPARFLMVGNSLRSDILPVIALGGWAVYIPYTITWSHEKAAPPADSGGRCLEAAHLGELPALVAGLEAGEG